MSEKVQTLSKLESFKVMFEKPMKTIQIDGGGEYTS
jgi:hypothetical protein